MQDRTSYSYRADLPGSRPDMQTKGGMARDAFKRVRMSPYIREQTQDRSQDGGDTRERFKTEHRKPAPSPKPKPSRSM